MTKQDFLDELKQALAGNVSADVMMDSYRYYANYIDDEMGKGKSEEQILEELGKPALIARSIIAAQTGAREADVEYTEDGRSRTVRRHHIGTHEQPSGEQREEAFGVWLGKLMQAVVVVGLIILVFFMLKVGFWVLITFGVPILLVLGVIYLLMYFLR